MQEHRYITLKDDCHRAAPLTVQVAILGADASIGSIDVSRPWHNYRVAMSRRELEQVRDCINAVLVASDR